MPRTLRPLSEPLRSWEGIRSDPHAPRNLLSEVALVRRRWESPSIRALRCSLDAVEHTTKPYKFPRSTLLGFCIVSLLLRCHLRDAHRRVQSDPALRELFGLPELRPATARRLENARRREDIGEADFPSRTLIENFIHRWLPAHPEMLEQLETTTYETLPLDAGLRHNIFFSRFTIDGTQLRSAHRGRRGESSDVGARLMGREGERAQLQRWKMTALLTDVPLVIEAETVTPDSETVHVGDVMVPRLKARSDRWRAQARQQGRPDFRGLDRAVALGDNAFANTPLWEKLYDHEMYGGFEPPEFPARVVDGHRLCSYKVPGEGDRSVDLFACNDGVHFCECEAKTPEAERTPMTQRAGRFGKTGEVYVICERFGCQHRGREVYVPFRKHDRELARERREGGEVDYTRVNPLWRGDSRVPAMNWLGRQTIEHYHQQRFELFGLGSKDRRSMRRFIGDPAHRFWHLLGDLLWNINVIENLESGLRPIELDPDIVCEHMLANGRNVARLKSLGRAGLAARAKKARRKRSRRGRYRSRAPAAPQAA